MPATVPQATAVVTAITAMQPKQIALQTSLSLAAQANAPVSPAQIAAMTTLAADLATALTAANTVLTNTP
jgi:hypothetical protein